MSIDHLVVRTPRRARLVSHLADRFQLQVLQGFRSGDTILSEGFRFRNGPFLDVFDWPADRRSFDPLVAVEADLAKAEAAAYARGLACRVHRRDDFDPGQRPPWSTLSFARGQGSISAIFIIEYETAPDAWQSEPFNGPLYDRNLQRRSNVTLEQIRLVSANVSASRAEIEAISGCQIPAFDFGLTEEGKEGVASLHLRDAGGELVCLPCSGFDRF